MIFNPVDFKHQDVKVIHAGTYVGNLVEGQRLKIKESDLADIKGGMFAAINASGELEICDGDTQTPIGMFYGDGQRPKGLTILIRGGLFMVKNFDDGVALNTFAPGTKLVVNSDGKLTPQGMSTNDVVAVVIKTPADAEDFLGIKLLV